MELELIKSDKELALKAETILLNQLLINSGKNVVLISKELRKWRRISRKYIVFTGKDNRRKFFGFVRFNRKSG